MVCCLEILLHLLKKSDASKKYKCLEKKKENYILKLNLFIIMYSKVYFKIKFIYSNIKHKLIRINHQLLLLNFKHRSNIILILLWNYNTLNS